jgi:hypothetical protein
MTQESEVNPASAASERVYRPSMVVRDAHSEGSITRMIEQQTARIPSDVFLFAALGAMGLSAFLYLRGSASSSRFVGMWPPALLTMGVYNKVVKMLGPR